MMTGERWDAVVNLIPVVRELRTDRERLLVARATDGSVLGSSSIPVPDVPDVAVYGARSSRRDVGRALLTLDLGSRSNRHVRFRQQLAEWCA